MLRWDTSPNVTPISPRHNIADPYSTKSDGPAPHHLGVLAEAQLSVFTSVDLVELDMYILLFFHRLVGPFLSPSNSTSKVVRAPYQGCLAMAPSYCHHSMVHRQILQIKSRKTFTPIFTILFVSQNNIMNWESFSLYFIDQDMVLWNVKYICSWMSTCDWFLDTPRIVKSEDAQAPYTEWHSFAHNTSSHVL